MGAERRKIVNKLEKEGGKVVSSERWKQSVIEIVGNCEKE